MVDLELPAEMQKLMFRPIVISILIIKVKIWSGRLVNNLMYIKDCWFRLKDLSIDEMVRA